MKRFALAIALTGLMSMTVLAGEVPINGAPVPAPPAPTTTSSATLAKVVLMVITLIGR